jgi:hypothetical protein
MGPKRAQIAAVGNSSQPECNPPPPFEQHSVNNGESTLVQTLPPDCTRSVLKQLLSRCFDFRLGEKTDKLSLIGF